MKRLMALILILWIGLCFTSVLKIALKSECFDVFHRTGVLERLDEMTDDVEFELVRVSGEPIDVLKKLERGEFPAMLWYGVTPAGLKYGLPLMSVDYALAFRGKKTRDEMKFIGTTRDILSVARHLFPRSTLVLFEDFETMVEGLRAGDVDAVFHLKPMLNAIEDVKMERVKGMRAFCRIVFSSSVPDEVVNEINERIIAMYRDGILEEILSDVKDVHPPNTVELVVIDWPPYEFEVDGKWKGTDVEVVERVFSRLGYRVKLVSYPPLRAFRMLRDGVLDGAFSLEKTPLREMFLEYVGTPVSTGCDVLFLSGDVDSLKDLVCGYVEGYANTDMLGKYCSEFVPVSNDKLGIALVLKKRLDAFMTNLLVGKYFLKLLDANGNVRISEPVREYESYLALSKKSPHVPLVPFLEEELERFKGEKEYERILERYEVYR